MRDRSIYLLIVALICLGPVVQRPVIATEILIFAIVALANNLILGYTGMLSFGQAMFFGIGAYAAGLLTVHTRLPLVVVLPAATLFTTVLAVVVGYFCVQRLGLYFIMLTFAFNQMFYFIAYSWTRLTGGEDGLPGVQRPLLLQGALPFYVFVAVLFLACLVLMKRVVDSPWGRLFRAIRDNEARAAATGHNVRRYKLLSFTISAAFTAFGGAVYSLLYGIVPIDAIHWLRSGDIVFMTLIGGSGNFFGPIIGAAFYIWLSETVSVVWNRWPMILGIVFALVVLFLRGGVVELVRRGYDLATARWRKAPAS
jgi:branched-chain amino acid transport system permease protein